MRHMCADASQDPLRRIDRHLPRVIFRQDLVALFDKMLRQLLGNDFLAAGDRDLGLLLHPLHKVQRYADPVLFHRPPDTGEPLIETGERVDAEEPEETGKPPGVIDVDKPQPKKPPIGALSIFLDIGFRPFVLLDDRPDRGGDGNEEKQEHRQLDRGEELDEFAGELLPSQPWSG